MSLSEKQVADYGEYVPISVKTKQNQQPKKHHKTALHVCMYVCIPNYYQRLITSREKKATGGEEPRGRFPFNVFLACSRFSR